MPGLRFLADMHISPLTVRELTARGWDIVRVSDALHESASDSQILAHARANRQVVVTQDLDFSALLAIGGHASPSVISLRLAQARPATVTRRLIEVISAMERELAAGIVASVDEATVRYRSLPIQLERD